MNMPKQLIINKSTTISMPTTRRTIALTIARVSGCVSGMNAALANLTTIVIHAGKNSVQMSAVKSSASSGMPPSLTAQMMTGFGTFKSAPKNSQHKSRNLMRSCNSNSMALTIPLAHLPPLTQTVAWAWASTVAPLKVS